MTNHISESYAFRTEPFEHQLAILNDSWDSEYCGLLMEQRTGKSKVVIDTAAILHSRGRINSVLIVAPNGVQRNWINEEIPKHLPEYIAWKGVVFDSAKTRKNTALLDSLFDAGYHLRVLAINYEAVATKAGSDFMKRFLNATECLFVADETTRIKTPTAAVTKQMLKLAKMARYRRILNGTPVTQAPFDLYAQLMFLSEDAVPTQSFISFKHRYADFLPDNHPLVQNIRRRGARYMPQIIASDKAGKPMYKNLDDLKSWVDKSCYRVTRAECCDLPEKMYKRWTVVLPDATKKTINGWLTAIKEGLTEEPVSKLTAVLLYQRLLCGTVPKQLSGTGNDEPLFSKPTDNPRIQAVLDIIDAYPRESIIFWARFRRDLHEISTAIEEHTGCPVARYWGDISDDEREEAKKDFQAGRTLHFVGQQGAGGVGLTLNKASVIVYHSNTFSLYHRLQSEDRAEHLQKENGTLIIDIEVPGTLDGKIINALRAKKDVADMITGDASGAWLTSLE